MSATAISELARPATTAHSWSALVGGDTFLDAAARRGNGVHALIRRRRRVPLAGFGHEPLDRILQRALYRAFEHVHGERRVELELETTRGDAHVVDLLA